MVEPASRPEEVIRRYLESRQGPVEAHIVHLKETFEVDDLSPKNLGRITQALGSAQIVVDPPLERVPKDGRLMLSIAAPEQAGAEPEQNGRDAKRAAKAEEKRRRQEEAEERKRQAAEAKKKDEERKAAQERERKRREAAEKAAAAKQAEEREAAERKQREADEQRKAAEAKRAAEQQREEERRTAAEAKDAEERQRAEQDRVTARERERQKLQQRRDAKRKQRSEAEEERKRRVAEREQRQRDEAGDQAEEQAPAAEGEQGQEHSDGRRLGFRGRRRGRREQTTHGQTTVASATAVESADGALAAIGDVLTRLETEAEQSLQRSGELLAGVGAASKELDGRLAQLDEGLRALVEGDGRLGKRFARSGERGNEISQELQQRVAAERDTLQQELSQDGWREEVQKRFAEVETAARELLEIQERGIAETPKGEQEHQETVVRVTHARTAVEKTLSDPSIGDQLEARVTALREAEAAEVKARETLDRARKGFKSRLGQSAARVHAAQEQLGQSLANRGDPAESLKARLDALGKAQGDALQPVVADLTALRESLDAHGKRATQLRTPLEEARQAVQGNGNGWSQQSLEAAIESNNVALQTLRSAEELLRTGRASVAKVAQEIEERGRRITFLSHELKESRSETESAQTQLARTSRELEEARAQHQAVKANAAEAGAQLERIGSELQTKLERQERELKAARSDLGAAEQRHSGLTRKLTESKQTLGQRQTQLAQAQQELERQAGEWTTKLEAARSAGHAAQARESALAQELRDAKNGIRDHAGKLATVRKEVGAAEERHAASAKELEQAKAELEQSARRAGEQEQQLLAARAEIAAAVEREQARAGELEQAKNELQQRQAELDEARASIERHAGELEAAQEEAKVAQGRVDKERKLSHSRNLTLTRELEEAKAALEQANAQLAEARARAEHAESEAAKAGEAAKAEAANAEAARTEAAEAGKVADTEAKRAEAAQAEATGTMEAAQAEAARAAEAVEVAKAAKAEAARIAEVARAAKTVESAHTEAAKNAEAAQAEAAKAEAAQTAPAESSKGEVRSTFPRRLRRGGGGAKAEEQAAAETKPTPVVKHEKAAELERKLAERETELEKIRTKELDTRERLSRVSRQLKDARLQLDERRGERRRDSDTSIVDAVDGVRRALMEGIEGAPPQDRTKPR